VKIFEGEGRWRVTEQRERESETDRERKIDSEEYERDLREGRVG
jgi:hypothetical protein